MADVRPPRIGSSRYYEAMWNEWREEQKAKGHWLLDRRRAADKRKQMTHVVSFSDLAAELKVLSAILKSRAPIDFMAYLAASGLVEENGRWSRKGGLGQEDRLTLGEIAENRIRRGHKADPTYAHIAWDCAVEASDFAAAKKQVRDHHMAYLASVKEKLTFGGPQKVK